MENIFLSIGRPYNDKYKEFTEALIKFGRDRGFNLQSVGYNVGTHNRPLVKIGEVLGNSKGAIIVAFSRIHLIEGSEKEVNLPESHITTPWNQIEAAMAYVKNLPMLVISEKGLKKEGLIEIGNDWYVNEMEMTPKSLEEKTFELSFEEWANAVRSTKRKPMENISEKMTISELFSQITVAKIIGLIIAFLTLLVGTFSAGVMFAGKWKKCLLNGKVKYDPEKIISYVLFDDKMLPEKELLAAKGKLQHIQAAISKIMTVNVYANNLRFVREGMEVEITTLSYPDGSSRYVGIGFSIRARDLGSTIAEAQKKVVEQVK